jgi:hypothetical protein
MPHQFMTIRSICPRVHTAGRQRRWPHRQELPEGTRQTLRAHLSCGLLINHANGTSASLQKGSVMIHWKIRLYHLGQGHPEGTTSDSLTSSGKSTA